MIALLGSETAEEIDARQGPLQIDELPVGKVLRLNTHRLQVLETGKGGGKFLAGTGGET